MNHWPKPGSIVSVPAYILFWHKGIVSDRWCDGKPLVISASARVGCGAEESWDLFSSGQQWRDEGYPGSLQPSQVLERARSLLGKPYDAFSWNCDMFVLACHGLSPVSVQLLLALVVAAAGAALAIAR
jgi:hypothetical protein